MIGNTYNHKDVKIVDVSTAIFQSFLAIAKHFTC